MLLIGILKHILQISLQFYPEQPASSNLLNLDDFLTSFIEVDLDIVSRSVTSIQALNENTWTVPLENSSQSVNIDLQVEQVLFSRLLFRIVGNVELHELVETSETVTEGCIFNSFFIGNDEVVEGKQ